MWGGWEGSWGWDGDLRWEGRGETKRGDKSLREGGRIGGGSQGLVKPYDRLGLVP